MTELKPCPFCGKKPVVEMWSSSGLMFMCKCNNPDCDVPLDGYPTGRKPADVIEEWNRRADNGQHDRDRY